MPFKHRSNEGCKIILSKVLYFGIFCVIFVIEVGRGVVAPRFSTTLYLASARFFYGLYSTISEPITHIILFMIWGWPLKSPMYKCHPLRIFSSEYICLSWKYKITHSAPCLHADSNLFLIVYRPVPSNIYNLPARAENQLILLSLALEKPNYNVGQRADTAGRAG